MLDLVIDFEDEGKKSGAVLTYKYSVFSYVHKMDHVKMLNDKDLMEMFTRLSEKKEENNEGDQGMDKKGAYEVDAMKERDDIDGDKCSERSYSTEDSDYNEEKELDEDIESNEESFVDEDNEVEEDNGENIHINEVGDDLIKDINHVREVGDETSEEADHKDGGKRKN
ncbi:hypothetical protein ACET3Z_013296 [Daucus carota]